MTDPIKPPEPGGTPPPPAEPPKEPPKTFTQEEVNRIVQERLTREQARFADYDDLKTKAGELKTIKDAQLTETEKLRNQIAALETEKADWDARLSAQELEQNEQLLRAEVRVQAAGMDFVDPDEAYLLADLGEVEADDRAKGVKKALEALVKAKPHLIKVAGAPGSPPNEPKKKGAGEATIDDYAEKYLGKPKKSGG